MHLKIIKMLKLILRMSTLFKNYYSQKMLVQEGLSLHYLLHVLKLVIWWGKASV